MIQPSSRTLSKLLSLVALAAGLGSPALAGDSGASLPPQILRTPGGLLEITGDPGRPLLLLGGPADPGTPESGKRLRAREIVRVPLDPAGRFTLPAPPSAERLVLQVWQPPGSGEEAGSGFSIPITLGGTVSLASAATIGDLVVTEFMKDPSAVTDGHGEWIELYNSKPWRLDIEGVTLADLSGASYVLNNGGLGILLAPGERYVLGNDGDPATNGGVPVDQVWSGFSLKNSSDEILLYGTNGYLVDAVVYDDGVRWPDTSGMSISLTHPVLDTVSNDTPGLWCHSSTALGSGGDTGTPGQPNDVCP